ncbi:MAG: ABC transporter permease [Clostridia bacterium]|nr:ABC transporter permease [Clostridia bacterium]
MSEWISGLSLILYATLTCGTPLLYAALGACFSGKAGVLNVGVEGMMLAGAFTGAAVAYLTGNPWAGFICGGLTGAYFGILQATATVCLGLNQIMAGISVILLAYAGTGIICSVLFSATETPYLSVAQKIPKLFTGIFDSSTYFGRCMDRVFATYASTWLVLFLLILAGFIFHRTRFGRQIQVCGEQPRFPFVNGKAVRFLCIVITGFLAGLGGACATMTVSSRFRLLPMAGQGLVAFAAAVMGRYRLPAVLPICLLCGFCFGARVAFAGISGVAHFLSVIPYGVAVLVLILSARKARGSSV